MELNETGYKLKIPDDGSIVVTTPNPYIYRDICRYLFFLLPAKELLTLPTEDLRKLVEVILSELECRRAKNKKAPITKLVMEIF
ncbi:hypothetical protein [Gimesia panareensis]|uniref:hypothetical protein n=1 Tax=Gimesia panareensis TaxID=2527978 RepID=UPI0011A7ADDC|nr:hypothetical protein [Gimesia panareensis]